MAKANQAPAEWIFEALTDPDQRMKCWGLAGRFEVTSMESDLRPGGKWVMRGAGYGGKPFTVGGEYRQRRRFALNLLGVFAALAAAPATIGVYGVISYSLSRRTTEFAIRLALGAEPRHLCRLLLRKFAAPVTVGLFGGMVLARWFAVALRTQLYKLSPADPLAPGISAMALLLLVIVSVLRPAARAASISGAAALRE